MTEHIESPPAFVDALRPMNEDEVQKAAIQQRLNALVRCGFTRSLMENFLAEHPGGELQRLEWLEARSQTVTEIEERLDDLTNIPHRTGQQMQELRNRLSNPFHIEDIYAQFNREMRGLLSWEPPMSIWKQDWMVSGNEKQWQELYQRFASLDVSSLPALETMLALLNQPERFDEIDRLLRLIEIDEQRQREMILGSIRELQTRGYAVGDLASLPIMEGLARLDAWQGFHNQREQLRLTILKLITPFDTELAREYEQRNDSFTALQSDSSIEQLHQEVLKVAQSLENRRQTLSKRIEEWRRMGIRFPHEGELQPQELLEWEANHDVIEQSVNHHLQIVERWQIFQKYWPHRTHSTEHLVGLLEQTAALSDAVDELDALWKKAELDALDILQQYEYGGIDVEGWRQEVFEDPMSSLERLKARHLEFARRLALIERYRQLDVSLHGAEDVEMRLQLLANDDLEQDVIEEFEGFAQKIERRQSRHRLMLEDELSTLRKMNISFEEKDTALMSLAELETHLATSQRRARSPRPIGNEHSLPEAMKSALTRELQSLKGLGWDVEDWVLLVEHHPTQVAQELSRSRPFLQQHDVIRRRLQRLPWDRDIPLALQIEFEIKQPKALEHLLSSIPSFMKHLASKESEDESYRISLWQPNRVHPLLVPLPESSSQHTPIRPSSPLDDAHDAMLLAMEEEGRLEPEKEGLELATTPSPPVVSEEEVFLPHQEHERDDKVGIGQDVEPVLDTGAQPQHDVELSDVESAQEPLENEQTVEPWGLENTEEQESQAVVHDSALKNEANGELLDSTSAALAAASELLSVLGYSDLAHLVQDDGLNAMAEVRRTLAQHVNIEPRDIRIGRLLRLTLRLLPQGDPDDQLRADLLTKICHLIPPLKRWMRHRLEARHSGAKGDFLADAKELGVALHRIPGLGRHVPLGMDDWPLPKDLIGLAKEVQNLQGAIMLPSAGGVQI